MRRAFRVICGSVLGLVLLCGGVSVPATSAASWSGHYSVLTQGSFSFQHTDYTCVGASVQMMLNMTDGTTSHSASVQMGYGRYGRDHSRYKPSNNGVDPVGWIAALSITAQAIIRSTWPRGSSRGCELWRRQ